MLAELVFLSRFLGLTFGERPVILRADPDVQRVELRRDGKTIATMYQPPWSTKVDFGRDLGPYELTAIGYGADGTAVARDSQLVNLARPAAEALIVLDRKGRHLTAKLLWLHIMGFPPTKAVMKFDGREVSRDIDAVPVPLGEITDDAVHVVSAELQFADGQNVRKEIVFGGGFSETLPAELTAVAVKQRADTPPAQARCITAGGRTIAPMAIENKPAMVSFIVNGGTPGWVHLPRKGLGIRGAELYFVEPVLRTGEGAEYFFSDRIPAHLGLREALRPRDLKGTRRFAEAVAASGMRALRLERRRAVVYVLGRTAQKDESGIDPVSVRRYLERVGVPLYVWSLTGPRPELAATWGEVIDVSSVELLRHELGALNADLQSQRMAWLPAAPLDAYRASATGDCAYLPLTAEGAMQRPWWARGRATRPATEKPPQ